MANSSIGGLTALLGVYIFLLIGIAVLMIIAQWKIFTKAGEPGWKILIPIYGEYVAYKIVWTGSAFWTQLVLAIICNLLTRVSIVFSIIGAILTLIFDIGYCVNLAKSFGRGGGFAVGLIFLPVIFMPILAFGNSEYILSGY